MINDLSTKQIELANNISKQEDILQTLNTIIQSYQELDKRIPKFTNEKYRIIAK